jgi:branched-chain amino acid transport system ATP-binding protein
MVAVEKGILTIDSLSKSFGKLQALNRVSFVVRHGSITSVIGPNGAGKTTLFNVVTGHLRADRGEVIFQGKRITNLPPHRVNRRGLSRSFQIVNIFPRFSVFENVHASVISKMRKNSSVMISLRRVGIEETSQILQTVGLSEHARTIAGTLSYGDQRILEIAIALGSRPELLLLDEPTAGMAPEETHATVELIKRLVSELGLTVLIVEHDMDVVFSISEAIIVLHQGMVLAHGKPDEVRRDEMVQKVYLGEEVDRSGKVEP